MTSPYLRTFAAPIAAFAIVACQTAPQSADQPIQPLKTAPAVSSKTPQAQPKPNGIPSHTAAPQKNAPSSPMGMAFPEVTAANFANLENAFALGDCPRVLDYWANFGLPETINRFSELPRLSAAAVAICNAQKSPQDSAKNRLAVHVLSELEQLPSPLLNKAWLAKTLASFHVALGEFSLATAAAQREQKYVQEQSGALAAQSAPLVPTNVAAPSASAPENPLDPERKFTDAKAALNAGDPATAVALLDSVSDADRSEKIRRLRRDAAEAHIKDMRTRARQQYMRAQGTQVKETKIEALRQCLSINEEILAKYPDTPSKPGIERSINSIKSEIAFLNKGV